MVRYLYLLFITLRSVSQKKNLEKGNSIGYVLGIEWFKFKVICSCSSIFTYIQSELYTFVLNLLYT